VDLRVMTSTVGGAHVLVLDGTADLSAVPAVHAALARAVAAAAGRTLVVDLDGTAVLDDAVLGLLVGAAARQRDTGGGLEIVCTGERLLERLARTRLDHILTVRRSLADGVTAAATCAPSGSSATN
jgi:anti-sigma B factor antagonist